MNVNREIAVIDDGDFCEELAEGMRLHLPQFVVQSFRSVSEALNGSSIQNAALILVDRDLKGEFVEEGDLLRLATAAPGSSIIVYTTVANLPDSIRYTLYHQGALRVLDKQEFDGFIRDFKLLKEELDLLVDLRVALTDLTRERTDFAATLLWADVAISVVDTAYHCWFVNEAQKRLTGDIPIDRVYWKQFFGLPETFGPSWGCAVTECIRTEKPVARLRFAQFANGDCRWCSIRVTPIFGQTTQRLVAVRKGVIELSDTDLRGMNFSERLQKIAETLIFSGFGRARIYESRVHDVLVPIAAASRKDDPTNTRHAYLESISTLVLKYNECPYAQSAIKNNQIVFVKAWDKRGKSVFADKLNLTPPYFLVPVYTDERLRGLVAIDYNDLQEDLRKESISFYAGDRGLVWMERIQSEVRRAFACAEGNRDTSNLSEVINTARIEIGLSDTVNAAVAALRRAFTRIVPNSCVSVRAKTPAGLEELDDLSVGERIAGLPKVIDFSDTNSLSAKVARTMVPLPINDYAGYRQYAKERGDPVGYVPKDFRSVITLPLMFETHILGTLGIDSRIPVDWTNLLTPLKQLADAAALVLRDLTLMNKVDADNAALIAYAGTTSSDSLWRHFGVQRLSEASNILTQALIQMKRSVPHNRVLMDMLQRVDEIIGILSRQQPMEGVEEETDVAKVVSDLKNDFKDAPVSFPSDTYSLQLKVPTFRVYHVLTVLINNSLHAIRTSQIGTSVELIAKVDRGFAFLEIHDDGPGIPDDVKRMLFKGTIKSVKGRGLGLLISRGVALQYHGDLYFESVPGNTTFTFKVPISV